MSKPNYFEFFELPTKLQIDTAALEKQFYALSRKLHPDRFAVKPAAEQEAALAQSSQLNDAYRTLKEPILRTQYLLGYYPAKQPPGLNFHHIRVTVPRAAENAFDIRYRTGYYADSQSEN